jgi:hypothetical protein
MTIHITYPTLDIPSPRSRRPSGKAIQSSACNKHLTAQNVYAVRARQRPRHQPRARGSSSQVFVEQRGCRNSRDTAVERPVPSPSFPIALQAPCYRPKSNPCVRVVNRSSEPSPSQHISPSSPIPPPNAKYRSPSISHSRVTRQKKKKESSQTTRYSLWSCSLFLEEKEQMRRRPQETCRARSAW